MAGVYLLQLPYQKELLSGGLNGQTAKNCLLWLRTPKSTLAMSIQPIQNGLWFVAMIAVSGILARVPIVKWKQRQPSILNHLLLHPATYLKGKS